MCCWASWPNAILSFQWEQAADNVDGCGRTHEYTLAQMLSNFESQAERARAAIDKEFDRQRESREKAEAVRRDDELAMFADVS